MKVLLVAVIAAFALVANAGDKTNTQSPKHCAEGSKSKATCCDSCCKAKPAKKAEVTGSRVPVNVDKNGVPVDSTLKVTVVNQSDVQIWGMGSSSAALSRLPMVTIRGKR